MVRNYVRKTKRLTPSDFLPAIRAIEEGSTIRAAAKQFNLPEKSLRRNRQLYLLKDESFEADLVSRGAGARTVRIHAILHHFS